MNDIRETFIEVFRSRFEEELPSEYLSSVNEFIRGQIGFNKYHQRINTIMKKYKKGEEYAQVCTKIKNYENEWQSAIYEYLTNKSFRAEIITYGEYFSN